MRTRLTWLLVILIAPVVIGRAVLAGLQLGSQGTRRNVIVFVADGLRHGSINAEDMPALSAIRAQGVDFENSYSLFPTFTMANASAIATGHRLGDTGTFSNTIWLGYPVFEGRNFNLAPGSPVPFLENDQLLGDVDDHFQGNFVGEETLLSLARSHGYNTAAVGKHGPAAMQDVAAIAPVNGEFPKALSAIVVDDISGTSTGIPLPPAVVAQLRKEGLPVESPTRSNGYGATSPYNNGYSGNNTQGGTAAANLVQQQWFADVATRVLLPLFENDSSKPFAMVFWSRDPDGTQHNQGDSLGTLYPGINGPTSRLAIRNADRNLQQLMAWLDSHPAIKANTDVFVTSDHGFATVSRHEVERSGRPTTSEAAKHAYVDGNGRVDTNQGTLPYGFLAIDLALDLHLDLFDPERRVLDAGRTPYKKLRLSTGEWEHPANGHGLIGSEVQKPDGSDAQAIVVANGGSDLIYVPDGNPAMVQRIVDLLLKYDYVGGVFVADRFSPIAGTLPLSAIGLVGSSALPRPDIVVAFKVFYFDPDNLQTAVQIADNTLQEGQGSHGGFGRDSTYNSMAAIGPDFKQHVVDAAPVGNADLAPTLASLLGFEMTQKGSLKGRVLREALSGGTQPTSVETKSLRSSPANGLETILFYQELDGTRYLQAACLVPAGRPAQSAAACR